ncbi:MAG TPA: hypothetical protein VI357_23595 [Mycobacteriales bacterium]
MSDDDVRLPQLLPVLSRGKHRNPRTGACFMELASFLAGERWSDHPACSHPLLAALARDVNDCTSDANRQRLAELIPSVIGLTSDDLHIDVLIGLRCATTALPVVSAERQQAMAVATLTCDRVLADLDGRPSSTLEERSRQALGQAPQAARWARQFISDMGPSPKVFRRHTAPCIVSSAVEGIAQACIAEPDNLLRDLLAGTIRECAARINPHVPHAQPAPIDRPRAEATSLSSKPG